MSYHDFENPETGETHGSFETFYVDECEIPNSESIDVDEEFLSAGFYWWTCFPGCIPDGEPNGPFETEEDAILDANDF